ncbi:MAG TPA: histidine kinase [Thermoanaerobaculia bacterium]|nr:histidine kinase [Thermoanaerobaculia bacterium]
MSPPALTARERVMIAVAVVGVTVGIRVAVVFATGVAGQQDWRMLPLASLTPVVLLPWGLAVLERFHHHRTPGRGWRTSALVVAYGCLTGVLAWVGYSALVFLDGESPDQTVLVRFSYQLAVWGLVLLFIGDGIAEAIHGHRAAVREGERRHEAEMAEAQEARQAIELRTRPDTVIAVLENAAGRTPADAAGAKRLLMRLARHQRMLLTQPSPPSFAEELRIVRGTVALFRSDVELEIGPCEEPPAPDAARPWLRALESALIEGPPGRYLVECDRPGHPVALHLQPLDSGQTPRSLAIELPPIAPQPDRRPPETGGELPSSFGSSVFTAALIVYLLASILPDLGSALERQPVWNVTVLTLASAALWLIVGPVLYRLTAVWVRVWFSGALLLSSASALFGAVFVTAASFALLRMVTIGDEFLTAYLPLVTSRNANVALVVGTSSFAGGFSRMLLAARADAMRAQQETLRAEARDLEARFHPHFLFNALASIVGLLRFDPAAAGDMCRLLARLVARTREHAGSPSWTVRDEVTFAADYLAIQQRRFGNRLHIARWEVLRSTMDAAIPRLSLQPLIENIFTHAVAASYGVISIGLSIEPRGRMLAVELWNDLADGPPTPGHGYGLAFVTHRVHAAGGRILVVPAEDRFLVHLTVPIAASARPPWRAAS